MRQMSLSIEVLAPGIHVTFHSVLQLTEGREFSKTIIPFALVGYEIDNGRLGATYLVGYLPSCIQRGLMELIVNYL